MNVNGLFRLIKDIALQTKTVRSAYDGDVYTIWNTSETKYASFVVGLRSATKANNMRTYNVVMYYGDRLMQDDRNKNSVWDDAINTLQTVLNKLNSLDDVEVVGDYTFQTFEQKFEDILAGAYVEIAINAEDVLGGCEITDIITEEEGLIEKLKEAIEDYREKDKELTNLLNSILYKVWGYTLSPEPI